MPRLRDDSRPQVARDVGIDDAMPHETAHRLEEVADDVDRPQPCRDRCRHECRSRLLIADERGEFAGDEHYRSLELDRLHDLTAFGERLDLIAAAHVAQLADSGDRRRRDDEQRADRRDRIDDLERHSVTSPAYLSTTSRRRTPLGYVP